MGRIYLLCCQHRYLLHTRVDPWRYLVVVVLDDMERIGLYIITSDEGKVQEHRVLVEVGVSWVMCVAQFLLQSFTTLNTNHDLKGLLITKIRGAATLTYGTLIKVQVPQ